ncbi:UDP-galactose-lipid carrier transferase [Leptospira sp. 2 VSF19]|uniref:UDP-galactose-lipid carrier transferase n=1 Tax=Leptospira soteropolitanensis TaxID=2950025 RepID=A0AAW5VJL7_9LEPT|nr:UDP-galactose-lipid carrier transferase [Leptospira soteropolitanensis]MCW7492373.1 UDP-galactose-lipid carrier transferase [Leptospira soteropolitanensis]MCW7499955.1 UDP-galactose-lipid carrier transferase [Leptospira soteropolitanensis]MCW7522206.1 UDP-galactose-lipid carrier transferase [Leptospira soteropolitanensis]MCW7526060.1 UDP-galactose-lipid carrier transferase [Leptospira soteropolitanensis]MCW7529826.1 UDP-galactose-lipid carrier transferase [Leptospira soteropolitanensis]
MKSSSSVSRILHLDQLNQEKKLPPDEYQMKMKILKNRIRDLTFLSKEKERPILFVFEGWDAAGKGGAIRRLTQEIDPRLFEVHNISAPNAEEIQHHYLWRFWNRIPKKGHIGIFDRSYYGRVLVERVEGFATETEWSRAYEEIALFEEQLISFGTIVIKFWLHIDSNEQLLRFESRKNDPLKRWKLTEEDWRNREKWPLYEEAANQMFQKTDSPKAPWFLIPANDKYFARTKVLETVVAKLQEELS